MKMFSFARVNFVGLPAFSGSRQTSAVISTRRVRMWDAERGSPSQREWEPNPADITPDAIFTYFDTSAGRWILFTILEISDDEDLLRLHLETPENNSQSSQAMHSTPTLHSTPHSTFRMSSSSHRQHRLNSIPYGRRREDFHGSDISTVLDGPSCICGMGSRGIGCYGMPSSWCDGRAICCNYLRASRDRVNERMSMEMRSAFDELTTFVREVCNELRVGLSSVSSERNSYERDSFPSTVNLGAGEYGHESEISLTEEQMQMAISARTLPQRLRVICEAVWGAELLQGFYLSPGRNNPRVLDVSAIFALMNRIAMETGRPEDVLTITIYRSMLSSLFSRARSRISINHNTSESDMAAPPSENEVASPASNNFDVSSGSQNTTNGSADIENQENVDLPSALTLSGLIRYGPLYPSHFDLCCVCLESNVCDTEFQPCGHRICQRCAIHLINCPLCRCFILQKTLVPIIGI